MHLSLPRRRVDNLFFQKSRQEAVVSVSGSQEGLESHGQINFGPHSSSLTPAGSSGRFESVIKDYSRTLCQIMEAGKRAPHTQTPPRSTMGQVPAFHLAALLRVRRWSRWSRLYGVWVPPADMKAGFFQPLLHCAQEKRWVTTNLGLRILNWAFHKPPFKMLMQNRVFGCIRPQVRSAAFDLKDPYFHVSILPCHRPFLRFAFEGRAYQYRSCPSGCPCRPMSSRK